MKRTALSLFSLIMLIGMALSVAASPVSAEDDGVEVQMAMVLDGSGSIGGTSWQIIRGGLADAVNDDDTDTGCIPRDGSVELTVVQFGDERAEVALGPVIITTDNAAEVADDIRSITQIGGYTPLACGIRLAADTLYGTTQSQQNSPTNNAGAFDDPANAHDYGGGYAQADDGDTHEYHDYGFSLPAGATIDGIEVRLDAWRRDNRTGSLDVELSWDGGGNWTSTGHGTGGLSRYQNPHTEYVGGSADTWGRTWTLSEISNLGVRLTASAGGGSDPWVRLDWVPITVYYHTDGFDPGIKQAINVVTDGEPNRCCDGYTGYSCTGTQPRASAVAARDYLLSKLQMTEAQDELDAEFIGSQGTASNWLRDYIVWPQPGYYAPEFDEGTGWVRVVATAQEFAETICEKFEMTLQGSITAHKFRDLDENGVQDAGEPDLEGWTMTLHEGSDCSGTPLDSGETNASGNVVFTGLEEGAYSVNETLQDGWTVTTPAGNPSVCRSVTLAAGQAQTVNFGNYEPWTPPYVAVNKTISPDPICINDTAQITLTVWGDGEPGWERLPVDVMLILDRSGSMGFDDPTRLSKAKEAAIDFIDLLDPAQDRVGLVSYASSASLDIGLTSDFNAVKAAINALSANGATNIGHAINVTNTEFLPPGNEGRAGAVWGQILLTDGVPNKPTGDGSNFEEADAQYARDEADQGDIVLYTIGLGAAPHLSQYFLDDKSASEHTYYPADPVHPYTLPGQDGLAYVGGGTYSYAPTADDLEFVFDHISQQLTNIAGTNVVAIEVLPDGVNYADNATIPPTSGPTTADGKTTLAWDIGNISIDDDPWSVTFDVTFDNPGYQWANVYDGSEPLEGARVSYTDYQGQPQELPFPPTHITVTGPPTADFSADDQTVCVGTNVTFTDKSNGNGRDIDTWAWSFTGGSITSAATQGPHEVSYDTAGNYTVSLNVTTECGDDLETKPDYITVTGPPTAAFSADPEAVCVNTTVNFTDESTGNGKPITDWQWDFGDGSANSTTEDPSHQYASAGSYNVTLTVSTDCGDDTLLRETYITVKVCATTINKTADPTTAIPGDTITYTISYENTGDAAVHNVTIEDDPDENYVDSISDISDSGTYDPLPGTGKITWNFVTLDPGDSGSVTYKATLKGPSNFPPGNTDVDNTATIDSDETEPEEGSATVTVTAEASLTIDKSADPTTAHPGDTILYTISYENTSDVAGHNVTIEDNPDENYIDSISAISVGGTYDDDIITWDFATLNPGDSGSVTYTTTLKGPSNFPPGNTDVNNTATIDMELAALSGIHDEVDVGAAGDIGEFLVVFDGQVGGVVLHEEDSATVTVTAEASLTISKSANVTSADPGDTILYTISYENTGDATVHNVTIEDDPDETYVDSISDISDGGSYDALPGTGIITWDIGDLGPGLGGSVTYTATLRGSGSFSPGTTNVRNTATIDSDETEETSTQATVTVTRPSEGDGRSDDREGDDYCYFDVDMLGEVTRLCYVCDTGRIIKSYVTPDPDEKHFLELEKRTKVTYYRGDFYNGGPPKVIVMTVADDPPPVPDGMVAIGPIYDFTGYTRSMKACSSVMFDRVIVAILDYPPDELDDLPGTASSLGLAYYDEEAKEWVFVSSDPGHVAGIGSESGQIRHFSSLAVMATLTPEPEAPSPPPEPAAPSPPPAHFAASDLTVVPSLEKTWEAIPFVTTIGKRVTITANIANDGGEEATYLAELKINGATVDTQKVRLGPGQSEQVSFALSVAQYGHYQVTVADLTGDFIASRIINWPLIVVLIAAAVVLIAGGLIWRIGRRRRRAAQTG